jgi:hypothetical protein
MGRFTGHHVPMTGADLIALTAVIAGSATAIYSLAGQHRTNMAMRRFEERWGVYMDYIVWFEERSKAGQSVPPAELQARLLAWGSPLVIRQVAEWTDESGAKVNKLIRDEFVTRRRPKAWGSPDYFPKVQERTGNRVVKRQLRKLAGGASSGEPTEGQ